MAFAPDNASFLLITGDTLLVNNRQIASAAGIDLIDTGPGGQLVVAPEGTLLALESLSSIGFLTQTTKGVLAARQFISDGSLIINNPFGILGDITLGVADNTSTQNINIQFNGEPVATTSTLNLKTGPGIGMNVISTGSTVEITILNDGGAPTGATYIIKTPDANLPSAFALSSLGSGILKTDGSGNISIAVSGTDYQAASPTLTAIAGLSAGLGSILVGTGSSWTSRSIGANGTVPVSNGSDWAWGTAGGGGGAPIDATYVTTTANGTLPSEFNLGGLTSGMLMQNVSGGISTPAIATPGTHYYLPAIPTLSPCTLYESGNSNLITIGGNYSGISGTGNIVIGKSIGATNAATGNVIIGLGAFPNNVPVTTVTIVGANAGPSLTVPIAPSLNNAGSYGKGAVFYQDDMYLLGNAARTCINYADPGLVTTQPWALQLGNDSGTILPQVFMLGSTNPTPANIPVNAGVFSVSSDGEPRFSNSNGVFPITISADVVPIAQGGTGQTTAAAALNALGVFSGTATLSGGTVVVSNPNIKTGSHITVTYDTQVTAGLLSAPRASIIDSTSFVINSSSGADASTVTYIFTQN